MGASRRFASLSRERFARRIVLRTRLERLYSECGFRRWTQRLVCILLGSQRMNPEPLRTWHRLVEERDGASLAAILDDDVVFHSPVVHTPQRGKALTQLYLLSALQVLNNPSFRYVREVVGPQDAVLEFETEIDGITINGVDLIRWNASGRIVDFKVMLRPLKAINLVHRLMGEQLQQSVSGN